MALYPAIPAYNSFRLAVSNLHTLHVEEAGNPNGKPIIFLHGGPGGCIDPQNRRYFDPQVWRIVLFDQRGSGKSTPHASLEENTTWDLVADIERIRTHLGIDTWHVFGGSWGSTLALAYAITHPDRVNGLVLRGIFLVRPEEIKWFYQEGASRVFPEAFEPYKMLIPEDERHDFVSAYYKRLRSPDKAVRLAAAKTWSTWEASTSKLLPDPNFIAGFGVDEFADAFARIECHYFSNDCFFSSPNFLLENAPKIAHIPCIIVHGRYDMVCPVENAWLLHQKLANSTLHIIADAGHSSLETGILEALVKATDTFAQKD